MGMASGIQAAPELWRATCFPYWESNSSHKARRKLVWSLYLSFDVPGQPSRCNRNVFVIATSSELLVKEEKECRRITYLRETDTLLLDAHHVSFSSLTGTQLATDRRYRRRSYDGCTRQ